MKRNIARLVPSEKNAIDAARLVMMPAVAGLGSPVIADWVMPWPGPRRIVGFDKSPATGPSASSWA